jgi:hypothetical protein
MFKIHAFTRRALLIGGGATVAAGALAASGTTSHGDEQPVAPAPAPFDLQAWLDDQTPANRANYHQTELARAMCEMSPGKWRTALTANQDFVIVIRDAVTTPENASVFVQYLY